MSFMGRAFGGRDRRSGQASPLDKVLADLREQENAEPIRPPSTSQETPPPPTPAPAPPAADHRERLEKLLDDARRIAQMLENESAEAALAENLKLDEKLAAVAKLAEAEAEARAQASTLTKQSESAAIHTAQIDTDVRAAQQTVTAAEESVKDLEARLAEAHHAVIQAKSQLDESEGRARASALERETHAAKVHAAEASLTKCREAREAAEAEVREAKAIARSIMQTAATLKQLRPIGSNGAVTAP